MAKEEAKLAEGAAIEAFGRRNFYQYPLSANNLVGLRNLTNEVRDLSYAEGINFADNRRSLVRIFSRSSTLRCSMARRALSKRTNKQRI